MEDPTAQQRQVYRASAYSLSNDVRCPLLLFPFIRLYIAVASHDQCIDTDMSAPRMCPCSNGYALCAFDVHLGLERDATLPTSSSIPRISASNYRRSTSGRT